MEYINEDKAKRVAPDGSVEDVSKMQETTTTAQIAAGSRAKLWTLPVENMKETHKQKYVKNQFSLTISRLFKLQFTRISKLWQQGDKQGLLVSVCATCWSASRRAPEFPKDHDHSWWLPEIFSPRDSDVTVDLTHISNFCLVIGLLKILGFKYATLPSVSFQVLIFLMRE